MSAVINDPDLYLPMRSRIVEASDLTPRERYFKLELPRPLGHRPGEFVMVSVPGAGECAISITCGPRDDNILEMVIRKAGNVTGVIHQLGAGDWLGIRGPFGSGFELDEFTGRDLLFVAGGLGLVPLRSLLLPVMANPERYGKINLIAGFRTPAEAMFLDELWAWKDIDNVNVTSMVDSTDHMAWGGEVGLVTEPIGKLRLDPANTLAALCGPPVMYKFVLMELAQHHGLPPQNIFVDLERRMKCGVGKCGHCQINNIYCCRQGPVFRYADLDRYPEAFT